MTDRIAAALERAREMSTPAGSHYFTLWDQHAAWHASLDVIEAA